MTSLRQIEANRRNALKSTVQRRMQESVARVITRFDTAWAPRPSSTLSRMPTTTRSVPERVEAVRPWRRQAIPFGIA